MTEKLKNDMVTAGCLNCNNYIVSGKAHIAMAKLSIMWCKKGHRQKYEVGAHFLCEDFKQLDFSSTSSNYIVDNYFKKR